MEQKALSYMFVVGLPVISRTFDKDTMRYRGLIICLILVTGQWSTAYGSEEVRAWEKNGPQTQQLVIDRVSISNTTFVVGLRFSGTDEKVAVQTTTGRKPGQSILTGIIEDGGIGGLIGYLMADPIMAPAPDGIRFSTHLVIRDGYANDIVYDKRATVISQNGALLLNIGRELPPCVTYELTIESFASGGSLSTTKRGEIGCQ
uniref:Uncharacterized protein n=1 Tax=Candidatus Kentrum eta TaxID=2126337 RepID=A0A450UA41_9GAMM|nr:MAG: hypothetical protein BECKH772A_GA0070896_1001211 [Candidatus Kentron sp. H]VFJ89789.1 MAG: hypothetical protein BECKH772B_GA0070898_1000647 [Candidatus Kentron sp. H]VFJ97162.1 MAG: hypothetical protein BECKH772C_GA0070978_1001111 [Candidatus Kentron sp. H]